MSPRVVVPLRPLEYDPSTSQAALRSRAARRRWDYGSPQRVAVQLADHADEAVGFVRPGWVSERSARELVMWAWTEELSTSWWRRLIARVVRRGFLMLSRAS